jgi:hypothetical protein
MLRRINQQKTILPQFKSSRMIKTVQIRLSVQNPVTIVPGCRSRIREFKIINVSLFREKTPRKKENHIHRVRERDGITVYPPDRVGNSYLVTVTIPVL